MVPRWVGRWRRTCAPRPARISSTGSRPEAGPASCETRAISVQGNCAPWLPELPRTCHVRALRRARPRGMTTSDWRCPPLLSAEQRSVHAYRRDRHSRASDPDACAVRGRAGLLFGDVEPGAFVGAWDRHRFRAGQPFAVGRRGHCTRVAFPGPAARSGQAGALRARRAVRRGRRYPQGLSDLWPLVRAGTEFRERQAALDPGGLCPWVCDAGAGYRDHLQMLRLLCARGRGRAALRRSRHRHRLGPWRYTRDAVCQGRGRGRLRGLRQPLRLRGGGTMKLLVTGGAGFIGSAVVRLAVSRGHQVVNVDALTYAACLDNVASVADSPDYAFEEADIRDRAAMDRILAAHEPDAIMHLAAESHVDRSIDGPGTFIDTNVTGTYTLLEAARGYWAAKGRPDTFRFHHISTDEVYGTLGATGLFTEDTPYAPNSPYSASKAASDHLVRAWAETYGLPVVLTNCSNNYGPYHFPEKLIPVVILNALAGKPIPVYGKGENVRDWLYVEDHADALLLVVEKGALGRSYNIGGNKERRNIDLVRTICGLLDERRPDAAPHDRLITFVEDRPGHDLRYAIDASRIRDELGWQPSVTVEEGLARTVDWYLENEDWWRALQSRTGVGERLGKAG